MRPFIFDLDGTLVDNVYEHVLAWKAAFESEAIDASCWKIHRRIGMDAHHLVREIAEDASATIGDDAVVRVSDRHGQIYRSAAGAPRPLPGALQLLGYLSSHSLPWAIATSGQRANAAASLRVLNADRPDAIVVSGDEVAHAKPDPDLFMEAARRLDTAPEAAIVVGDSVWDMLAAVRCGAAPIGLLSGGTSEHRLREAGAVHIFADPAAILIHLRAGQLG